MRTDECEATEKADVWTIVYFWNKHRAEHSGTGLRFSRHRGDGRVEKTHPTELQSVE